MFGHTLLTNQGKQNILPLSTIYQRMDNALNNTSWLLSRCYAVIQVLPVYVFAVFSKLRC